jgi:hypothetical protein
MTSESEIQADILEYLAKAIPGHVGFFYRTEPAGAGGWHRSHKRDRGMPDITGCYRGYWIGIEVKNDTGKLRDSQIAFRDNISKAYGFYVVCRSVDDVIAALKRVDERIKE